MPREETLRGRLCVQPEKQKTGEIMLSEWYSTREGLEEERQKLVLYVNQLASLREKLNRVRSANESFFVAHMKERVDKWELELMAAAECRRALESGYLPRNTVGSRVSQFLGGVQGDYAANKNKRFGLFPPAISTLER